MYENFAVNAKKYSSLCGVRSSLKKMETYVDSFNTQKTDILLISIEEQCIEAAMKPLQIRHQRFKLRHGFINIINLNEFQVELTPLLPAPSTRHQLPLNNRHCPRTPEYSPRSLSSIRIKIGHFWVKSLRPVWINFFAKCYSEKFG